MKPSYYNEIDTYAADWLRNLIAAGHIADGDVDTRSIEDVHPDDLRGYAQCHFFAGIGVWSYALRRAGWPDDRPVWTGSCPCQPFSAAGKGAGFADERHLWPAFHHLIRECKPATVLGEQVASSDVGPWLDLVQDDVEAMGYAFGAVAFPSAGVGAPHIRDRLYWVADAGRTRLEGSQRAGQRTHAQRSAAQRGGAAGGLAYAQQHSGRCEAAAPCDGEAQTNGPADRAGGCGGASGGLADASGERRVGREGVQAGRVDDRSHAGRIQDHHGLVGGDETGIPRSAAAGPTNGLWRDADWLLCRDGRWRPVEPGTFPLAHGLPPEWDACAPTATGSARRRQKPSSAA